MCDLEDVLPWLRFLPEADRRRFDLELVQWRNTAFVWSCPELLGEITCGDED